jgi:hypothetical protein
VTLADVSAEPVGAVAAELGDGASATTLDVREEEAVRAAARDVNAVCPGTVDSPWVRRLVEGAGDSLEALRARQLMGRLGTPGKIAEAVAYLASDDAAFVTGTAFVIDGGLTAA